MKKWVEIEFLAAERPSFIIEEVAKPGFPNNIGGEVAVTALLECFVTINSYIIMYACN